jgi:hypothetical protein
VKSDIAIDEISESSLQSILHLQFVVLQQWKTSSLSRPDVLSVSITADFFLVSCRLLTAVALRCDAALADDDPILPQTLY